MVRKRKPVREQFGRGEVIHFRKRFENPKAGVPKGRKGRRPSLDAGRKASRVAGPGDTALIKEWERYPGALDLQGVDDGTEAKSTKREDGKQPEKERRVVDRSGKAFTLPVAFDKEGNREHRDSHRGRRYLMAVGFKAPTFKDGEELGKRVPWFTENDVKDALVAVARSVQPSDEITDRAYYMVKWHHLPEEERLRISSRDGKAYTTGFIAVRVSLLDGEPYIAQLGDDRPVTDKEALRDIFKDMERGHDGTALVKKWAAGEGGQQAFERAERNRELEQEETRLREEKADQEYRFQQAYRGLENLKGVRKGAFTIMHQDGETAKVSKKEVDGLLVSGAPLYAVREYSGSRGTRYYGVTHLPSGLDVTPRKRLYDLSRAEAAGYARWLTKRVPSGMEKEKPAEITVKMVGAAAKEWLDRRIGEGVVS